jgi:hypothetical protein
LIDAKAKNEYSGIVKLDWNLFNGTMDSHAVEQEKITLLKNQKSLEKVKRDLIQEIKDLYHTYTITQKRIENFHELYTTNRMIHKDSLNKLADGTRTFVDVLSDKKSVLKVQEDIAQLEFTYHDTYFQLLNHLGLLESAVGGVHRGKVAIVEQPDHPMIVESIALESTTMPADMNDTEIEKLFPEEIKEINEIDVEVDDTTAKMLTSPEKPIVEVVKKSSEDIKSHPFNQIDFFGRFNEMAAAIHVATPTQMKETVSEKVDFFDRFDEMVSSITVATPMKQTKNKVLEVEVQHSDITKLFPGAIRNDKGSVVKPKKRKKRAAPKRLDKEFSMEKEYATLD